jgi:RNA-directed DNA polymerase
MSVQRQHGSVSQGDLFDEALKAAVRHGVGSEGGTGPATTEEPQAPTAWDHDRALTQHLMEQVSSTANLSRAYKRGKANGGAPGRDGMTVDALRAWMAAHRERLIVSLLDGSYQPQPVRGVSIPNRAAGNASVASPP